MSLQGYIANSDMVTLKHSSHLHISGLDVRGHMTSRKWRVMFGRRRKHVWPNHLHIAMVFCWNFPNIVFVLYHGNTASVALLLNCFLKVVYKVLSNFIFSCSNFGKMKGQPATHYLRTQSKPFGLLVGHQSFIDKKKHKTCCMNKMKEERVVLCGCQRL